MRINALSDKLGKSDGNVACRMGTAEVHSQQVLYPQELLNLGRNKLINRSSSYQRDGEQGTEDGNDPVL